MATPRPCTLLQRVPPAPAGQLRQQAKAQRRGGQRALPRKLTTAASAAPSGGGDGSSSSAAATTPSSTGAQPPSSSQHGVSGLSPEARQVFKEAQENIMRLNESRLRALEELRAARRKIAELEVRVEEAVAEANQAAAQVTELSGRGAKSPVVELPEVTFKFEGSSMQAEQPTPSTAAVAAPQVAAAGSSGGITVVYRTGWQDAFLHYSADGTGWTSAPGTRMSSGTQQFPGDKVLQVPGSRLEFVVNNGGQDWDSPFGGGNYSVRGPGVYRLKNGRVTKLS